MFSAGGIFLALIYINIAFVFADGTRRNTFMRKAIVFIGLLASIYCIAAGINILQDWANPLADLGSKERAQFSSKQGGRAGFLLFIISIWPFFLIGFGLLSGFIYGNGLFRKKSSADPNL